MYDCFKDDVTFKICEINLNNYSWYEQEDTKELALKR